MKNERDHRSRVNLITINGIYDLFLPSNETLFPSLSFYFQGLVLPCIGYPVPDIVRNKRTDVVHLIVSASRLPVPSH